MLWILLILFIAGGTLAQLPFSNTCPNLTMVPNFELETFMGKWYEVERNVGLLGFGGKCITANYYPLHNDTDDGIRIINLHISSLTGDVKIIEGWGFLIDEEKRACIKAGVGYPLLLFTFPSVNFIIPVPYWILDTDYIRIMRSFRPA